MQDFRNCHAWQKAHALLLTIYRETTSMPHEEVFGVTLQLRRSGIAVSSRIAEGCGRESNAEFAVDLRRSIASCSELEYLMMLARDLQLWKPELADELMAAAVEVRKMTHGLLHKL
jgi:four helix bundle protein